jgi:hypothetical protein
MSVVSKTLNADRLHGFLKTFVVTPTYGFCCVWGLSCLVLRLVSGVASMGH